jgi:YaiO family outer membrane protein
MYCSTAISNKKNFPYSRFSIEPYTKLPASFEMSLGFRYLNFDDSRFVVFDASKVMIYTGSIGKYYGDYWFSFRPYLTPGKDGWSKSVNFIVRRYLSDEDSYFSLILGTGLSPDEQQYAYNPSLSYLKSNKIALEYQQKIGSGFFLDCGTGFAREEILAGTKRNRFTFDVGVSFLF